MTHAKRLESSGQQNSAAYPRLDVEVIGDFQVVDDRLQNLIDFSRRCYQTLPLQAVSDIDFTHTIPRTLRLNGRVIVAAIRMINHASGLLYENFSHLLL